MTDQAHRPTPRIEWVGDSMARLIWICRDCGANGSGEDQSGIEAANLHRASPNACAAIQADLNRNAI